MSVLQSLSSWIAYAIFGAFLPESWAATVAALVAWSVVGLAMRAGLKGGELVIELASAAFFTVYAIVVWATHADPGVTRWVGPASQFWLAAAVAVGLLTHHPFTLPIARRSAPAELHETEWFYGLNVKLTRAWLVSFVTSGLVLAVAALLHQSHIWLNIICIATAIIAPTLYTRRVVGEQPGSA